MSRSDPARGPSRAGIVVIVALAIVLAGLGISVAAIAGIADVVRAGANQLTSAPSVARSKPRTVVENMKILTSKAFGPTYTNAAWSVHIGDTVVVRITSYDDGTAPLTGVQAMMFSRVEGTVGGVETVAGKPVRGVANDEIAHTFTVVGLGLNLPIPAAPTGRSVTVVARFVARRAGTFVWQCYAPCGSGPNLMGGPMSTASWMEGRVKVLR